MKLNLYSVDELLEIGSSDFKSFISRPNIYKLNGRSPEQMQEDRLWGDLSELAFRIDTGANDSGIKYEDLILNNIELYGEQVSGLIEIKTIPRMDDTAATTAIQNYFLKHKIGAKRADYFAVYCSDRISRVLTPYGFYRRGFANAIEPICVNNHLTKG